MPADLLRNLSGLATRLLLGHVLTNLEGGDGNQDSRHRGHYPTEYDIALNNLHINDNIKFDKCYKSVKTVLNNFKTQYEDAVYFHSIKCLLKEIRFVVQKRKCYLVTQERKKKER